MAETWDDAWLAQHQAKMAGLVAPAAPPAKPEPKRGGRKISSLLRDPTEDEIQKAAAEYLELALPPPLRFMHIPNGGSRHPAEAAKLKGMGVQEGAADLLILGWPRSFIWIELKSRNGRLRTAQAEWRDWCRAIGAPWFLCRSVEDVADALESLQIRLIGRLK